MAYIKPKSKKAVKKDIENEHDEPKSEEPKITKSKKPIKKEKPIEKSIEQTFEIELKGDKIITDISSILSEYDPRPKTIQQLVVLKPEAIQYVKNQTIPFELPECTCDCDRCADCSQKLTTISAGQEKLGILRWLKEKITIAHAAIAMDVKVIKFIENPTEGMKKIVAFAA
jgi:hypothetical protein